jgi:hypothetical protein
MQVWPVSNPGNGLPLRCQEKQAAGGAASTANT